MTTIAQLEETARQERRSADDFSSLADKHPLREDEYKDCASLCRARAEDAELLIKATKEGATYNQFDHRREPDEQE